MKEGSQRTYIEARGLPTERLVAYALREGNSKLPVYKMHKWWARRLGSIVRAVLLGLLLPDTATETDFWEAYSGSSYDISRGRCARPVVFDPFFGGGSTLVEAHRMGCDCVGYDVDPMAWFITRQELSTVDLEQLESAFQQVREKAQAQVARFYKTRLQSGSEHDVTYFFWVRTTTCPHCSETIELHPHYQLARDGKHHRQVCFCSSCHKVHELPDDIALFHCEECGAVTHIGEGSVSRTAILCPWCRQSSARSQLRQEEGLRGAKLFALQYLDGSENSRLTKRFKRADEHDDSLFRLAKLEFTRIAQEVPLMEAILNAAIPSDGRTDMRPITYGFRRYAELFNERQLVCLARILHAIESIEEEAIQELLLLAFSDSLASNNMFSYYAFDYDKLTPLFGLHGYNIITRPVENNVWGAALGRGTFRNCYKKVVDGVRYMDNCRRGTCGPPPQLRSVGQRATESHGSGLQSDRDANVVFLGRGSGHDTAMAANSVDLVLTDPPYFDNLHYGEMSDFFYAWLRPVLRDRYSEEFEPPDCVNLGDRVHGNGGQDALELFASGLTLVFSECARILKDTGILALTFHHRDEAAWLALCRALAQSGFTIVQVVPLRSEGKSGFHSAPGNLKWDAVVVCRRSNVASPYRRPNHADIRRQWSEFERRLAGVSAGPGDGDWHSLRCAYECWIRHVQGDTVTRQGIAGAVAEAHML